MDVNLQNAHDRFTEIVAMALDIYDQEAQGAYPPYDHERWKTRYHGRPWSELPPMTIEFNRFRPVVQMVVSQLMLALDDDDWKKATAPIPGLTNMETKP